MKKNGQYVGVDEKYIPEEEKYVDNEVNGEIKKKGIKYLKIFGIGYLSYKAILIIFDKTSSIFDKTADKVFDEVTDESDEYSEAEIKGFNIMFEFYNGSQKGSLLETLINSVVTNNKTNAKHIITVVYNETITTVPDEITKLKQNFEDKKEYEVSLDYDTNGFVNKITIKDIN